MKKKRRNAYLQVSLSIEIGSTVVTPPRMRITHPTMIPKPISRPKKAIASRTIGLVLPSILMRRIEILVILIILITFSLIIRISRMRI
jgi:hypothetical protein